MKNIVFIILSLIVLTGCSKATNEDTLSDVETEQYRKILSSQSWQLTMSSNPNYNTDKEKSIVYQYKPNGELWFSGSHGYEKGGSWSIKNKVLTEIWGKTTGNKSEFKILEINNTEYACVELSNSYTYNYKSVKLENQ